MSTKHAGFGQEFWRKLKKALSLQSIKGKIFMVFTVTLLSLTAMTALNFWNLSMLRSQMLLSERYDDLLNNILEVRRFEKNFLIYGDSISLLEGKEYLTRIDKLVDDLSTDLPTVIGKGAFNTFRDHLAEYHTLVGKILKGEHPDLAGVRNLGKSVTEDADHFRATKRMLIHSTIIRSSILPFAFLLVVLVLMVLIMWLISHGLLEPLAVVMGTTRQVARGDFSPIRYEEGGRLEEISVLIEAFNRMAQELESNQEDLIQARKIAAIGTFTAGIAHELNNPINNIILTAESFGEEYGQMMDAGCLEMLRDILNQAERAADIVKNLLDFSRTDNPIFTRIEPARLLRSTINLVKNQFKIVGIQLETSIEPELPAIIGNPGNLQQVFTNLLLNAIQASPPGGMVSLRVDRADDPGFVQFTIQDSGPGIPPELKHKIFEPFFSTKEVGKGTGLGLAVTYSIIKRHGGRIDVVSEPGSGACFSVLLPRVDQVGETADSVKEIS